MSVKITKFSPITNTYFGESGVTSTRANQLCDAAKHSYEALESELDNINFIVEKFGLIGTREDAFTIARAANSSCIYEKYKAKLDRITELKSFIAFLREAVKHKSELADEINRYESQEVRDLEAPESERVITEYDVINNMTVKEREHYLSLETKCAVYGKFIHPGRRLDRAIKEINLAKANPRTIDYNGSNTIIKTRESLVSIEDANATYDKLQKDHRAAESELNGLKHKIEETIKEDEAKKVEAYKKAYNEYYAKMVELTTKDKEIREARRKEIQNLKIVIPNRFKTIYEELTKTNSK